MPPRPARTLAFVLHLATVAAALAPLTPRAADITVTETGDDPDGKINIADCTADAKSNLSLRWAVSSTATSYGLWVSNQAFSGTGTSGCASKASTATGTVYQAVSTNITTVSGSLVTYPASGTTPSKTLMALAGLSACSGTQPALYLCVEYNTSSGTTNGVTDQIKVDFTVPDAPTGVTAEPGDSALTVHWEQTTLTDSYGYRVFWGPKGTAADSLSTHDMVGVGSNSFRIDGLTNGREYDVYVATLSPARNVGKPSTPAVTATPVLVNDLWRSYEAAGGREEGGCASGPAGLLALLGVLPFAFRRGRRA